LDKKKAIIFDVDNTLIDRRKSFNDFCEYFIELYAERYPYEGEKEALIQYMVDIDEDGYGGLENFIIKLKKVWRLPHSVEGFIKERNEIFGSLTVTYEETHEVLGALKERYKLGIITNGYSSVQREKIRLAGVTDYFEDIIVSGEEEFAKPDERIFKLSCSRLGVAPEEAVYVGDYYPNDIAGALKAKIMPIWINTDPEEHKEYGGIRVKRLKDILNYL
jgi:putative hydrolase of the HAD superfamily